MVTGGEVLLGHNHGCGGKRILGKHANRTAVGRQFDDSESDLSLKLGLLVYMWVAPKWRGRKLGDMLLSIAVEQCLSKGDKYMLCVHDDEGSGKLVEWYKQRCFEVVPEEILDKGLIGMLRLSIN